MALQLGHQALPFLAQMVEPAEFLVQDTDRVTALNETTVECGWGMMAEKSPAADLNIVSVRAAWRPFSCADFA